MSRRIFYQVETFYLIFLAIPQFYLLPLNNSVFILFVNIFFKEMFLSRTKMYTLKYFQGITLHMDVFNLP